MPQDQLHHQIGERCPCLQRQFPPHWRSHYDSGAIAAKQVELLRARQIAHPLDPAFPSADWHGLLFDSGREKSVIRLKPARSIKRMDPLARAAADHAMPTRPLN